MKQKYQKQHQYYQKCFSGSFFIGSHAGGISVNNCLADRMIHLFRFRFLQPPKLFFLCDTFPHLQVNKFLLL